MFLPLPFVVMSRINDAQRHVGQWDWFMVLEKEGLSQSKHWPWGALQCLAESILFRFFQPVDKHLNDRSNTGFSRSLRALKTILRYVGRACALCKQTERLFKQLLISSRRLILRSQNRHFFFCQDYGWVLYLQLLLVARLGYQVLSFHLYWCFGLGLKKNLLLEHNTFDQNKFDG